MDKEKQLYESFLVQQILLRLGALKQAAPPMPQQSWDSLYTRTLIIFRAALRLPLGDSFQLLGANPAIWHIPEEV